MKTKTKGFWNPIQEKVKTKVFQTSEFHKRNSDSAQEPDKVGQVVLDILYKERISLELYRNSSYIFHYSFV